MDSSTDSSYQRHQFQVESKKGTFLVTILENTSSVMTTCTCGGLQKCAHVLQVLAGISANMRQTDMQSMDSLQDRLASSPDGIKILSKAKRSLRFQVECPGCQGKNITRVSKIRKLTTNLIVKGGVIGYKCLDCKKSW